MERHAMARWKTIHVAKRVCSVTPVAIVVLAGAISSGYYAAWRTPWFVAAMHRGNVALWRRSQPRPAWRFVSQSTPKAGWRPSLPIFRDVGTERWFVEIPLWLALLLVLAIM